MKKNKPLGERTLWEYTERVATQLYFHSPVLVIYILSFDRHLLHQQWTVNLTVALYDRKGPAFLLGASVEIAIHSSSPFWDVQFQVVTQSPESAANTLRMTQSTGAPTEHQ